MKAGEKGGVRREVEERPVGADVEVRKLLAVRCKDRDGEVRFAVERGEARHGPLCGHVLDEGKDVAVDGKTRELGEAEIRKSRPGVEAYAV